MTTLAATLEAPYKPRHVRFIRREDVEGWQLKLYGIAVNGQEPRPDFVAATRGLAAQVLPQPPAGEDHYGVGFAIAHDARARSESRSSTGGSPKMRSIRGST